MEIFLIVLLVLLFLGTIAYYFLQKSSKASLDAEIDRIKIPDDTFDDPKQK